MRVRSAVLSLSALALLLGACGGSSSGDDATETPTATSSVTAAGPVLSDEEYLRVFCTGITKFRLALNTEPREGLVRVVEEYRDSMAAVNPPEDIAEFHLAFVQYLEEAVEEPTALITRQPPVPPDDARDRLAEKTDDVAECEYPTFLDGEAS